MTQKYQQKKKTNNGTKKPCRTENGTFNLIFYFFFPFTVLLIALVTLGAILFALLLMCIIATCVQKRRRPNNRLINTAIGVLPTNHKSISGLHSQSSKIDKKAIIHDTSSETSEDTTTLPYVANVSSDLIETWWVFFVF